MKVMGVSKKEVERGNLWELHELRKLGVNGKLFPAQTFTDFGNE